MGIGIPDRFGGFRESNDEFLRIVGYTREDMKAGRVRWDTMTPKEYAELDQAHIEEAAQRGSCTPYEKEYIRKDGTRVPIFCGYALLEGSRDQYIGFVRDMSAEKRAEALCASASSAIASWPRACRNSFGNVTRKESTFIATSVYWIMLAAPSIG